MAAAAYRITPTVSTVQSLSKQQRIQYFTTQKARNQQANEKASSPTKKLNKIYLIRINKKFLRHSMSSRHSLMHVDGRRIQDVSKGFMDKISIICDVCCFVFVHLYLHSFINI